jgi:hypothetical protein
MQILQDFLYSPQAVGLAAVRTLLQAVLHCPAAAEAAATKALLAQLQATLAANVAVLTGRAPPTFTERANSCMWCGCLLNKPISLRGPITFRSLVLLGLQIAWTLSNPAGL